MHHVASFSSASKKSRRTSKAYRAKLAHMLRLKRACTKALHAHRHSVARSRRELGALYRHRARYSTRRRRSRRSTKKKVVKKRVHRVMDGSRRIVHKRVYKKRIHRVMDGSHRIRPVRPARRMGASDKHGCNGTLPPRHATKWDAKKKRCVKMYPTKRVVLKKKKLVKKLVKKKTKKAKKGLADPGLNARIAKAKKAAKRAAAMRRLKARSLRRLLHYQMRRAKKICHHARVAARKLRQRKASRPTYGSSASAIHAFATARKTRAETTLVQVTHHVASFSSASKKSRRMSNARRAKLAHVLRLKRACTKALHAHRHSVAKSRRELDAILVPK